MEETVEGTAEGDADGTIASELGAHDGASEFGVLEECDEDDDDDDDEDEDEDEDEEGRSKVSHDELRISPRSPRISLTPRGDRR